MNDFDTMVRILTDRIAVLNTTVSDLEDSIQDKNCAITDLDDQLVETRATLRAVQEDRSYYEERVRILNSELASLRKSFYDQNADLMKYRLSDTTLVGKADEWMKANHQTCIHVDGVLKGKHDRIKMIKEVRQILGWGLKESKDYVEAWLAKTQTIHAA